MTWARPSIPVVAFAGREYVLAIVILLALVYFVTAPLRAGGGEDGGSESEDPVLAELEARKQAKYREIRDAEMDRAQGKLERGGLSPPGRRAARGGDRDPEGGRPGAGEGSGVRK